LKLNFREKGVRNGSPFFSIQDLEEKLGSSSFPYTIKAYNHIEEHHLDTLYYLYFSKVKQVRQANKNGVILLLLLPGKMIILCIENIKLIKTLRQLQPRKVKPSCIYYFHKK